MISSPNFWHKTQISRGLNLIPTRKLGGNKRIEGLSTYNKTIYP